MEELGYKLEDLIDIPLLQELQDKLNEVYSFPSAIIDNEGKILTAVAWQDICTKFHRKNPLCEKECIKSDQYISEHLHEAKPAVSYQCPHGLIDNATPIIIDGKHLGNFFTGQFFLEKPDIEFFKKQAQKYGFNEVDYLEAVTKVPIWTKEKVSIYLDFIKGFIQIIASLGLKNLKEKELNENLTKSEERFRLLIENSADMVTLHDSDGKYLYYSGPHKYRINPRDVIGKTPFDFFEKEIANQICEQIKKTYQTGEHKKLEIYINWQGKMTWFEENIYPIKKDNEIISVVKICSDITTRKNREFEIIKAKEKAEESEQKLSRIIESTDDFIWTVDPINFGIQTYNSALYKYFLEKRGIRIKMGDTPNILIPSRTDEWINFYKKALELGTYETEYEVVTGSNTLYLSLNKLVRDDKVFGISVFGRDITKLKENEKELIKAKEKAEESDRLKTAFLQNMSHEIRTPMNAILGFAELIPLNFNDKFRLEKFSTIINQRCTDLLKIIDDLLDISKIESGLLTAYFEQCNLTKLFNEINSFFSEHQYRLNKNHISFILKSHPQFDNVIISTDTVKLKQIFINLLINAFKFTEKGKVEAGCKSLNDQEIIFYVSDTGIGIPADKHEVIFQRFAQLEYTANRFYGGNGIGLSIVKALVNLLGGRVWLESEVGKGSTFYFSIDYKKPISHETLILDSNYTRNNNNELKNKTILIVEDDTHNASLFNEMLSSTGLKLIYAVTGSEAIQKAEEYQPDLILMDIGLPDIKGYDATRLILAQNPKIKIVAQTAYASSSDRLEAFNAGCIDHLSKPINEQVLHSVLNKHLV